MPIDKIAGLESMNRIIDSIETARASLFASAETVIAVAAQAESARTSGQGGLFGGDDVGAASVQLAPTATWTLVERMAQEKEAFGFYFSAHPVDRYRHVMDIHHARTFAAISSMPAPVDGSRSGAMLAGLVEDVRWRTSARGRRYAMVTVSDPSGQFVATCFDDHVSAELEDVAGAGDCVLLTVELDRKPGEETPRVTVKRVQRFDALADNVRLRLAIEITDAHSFTELARLLDGLRGGRSEVTVSAAIPNGTASLRLGRDFMLDAEIAARIEGVAGVISATLSAADPPRLALVS